MLQAALLRMDDSALSLEHLDALSRAIPDDTESRDIQAYLKVPSGPSVCKADAP